MRKYQENIQDVSVSCPQEASQILFTLIALNGKEKIALLKPFPVFQTQKLIFMFKFGVHIYLFAFEGC